MHGADVQEGDIEQVMAADMAVEAEAAAVEQDGDWECVIHTHQAWRSSTKE